MFLCPFPRLDLVSQVSEVEARREEYPETLAFIRLLNALVGAALLRDGHGAGFLFFLCSLRGWGGCVCWLLAGRLGGGAGWIDAGRWVLGG